MTQTNRFDTAYSEMPASWDDPLQDAIPHEPPTNGEVFLARASSQEALSCFGPLHYESGYAYPLVVWLHGTGDSDAQLKRIMPSISMRNYVAIAPRGTECLRQNGCAAGYSWRQSISGIMRAETVVTEAIEMARDKFHIHDRRIFLAGFDAGGTMAVRIALRQPELFGGALSLCGPFPTDHQPLQCFNAARGFPIFLGVGRRSEAYADAHVCRDLRLMYMAGLRTTLRQYPCGHEIDGNMLADVDRWIMDQLATAMV